MTTQISAAAASARETSRTAGGQFGTQPLPEADLELDATLNPLGGGRVIMLTKPSPMTQPIIDAAVTRAIGPVRVDDQDQGTTTRISYRDPMAGMVEIFHAPGFVAHPTIIDESGRNLRGTQAAAAVLAPEHLSPNEKRIAAAKLTEADQKLIDQLADQYPGQLSVVEHSVRTLRAAGIGARLSPGDITDPMHPSFEIADGTPWVTTLTFTGSDAVEIEGMGAVQPKIGANAGSVPAPSSVRWHLADAAKQRSYAARMGPEMRKLVHRGSIERTDADGNYERLADPSTWAAEDYVSTTFRLRNHTDSDERLEMARTETGYELRVAPNWAVGVPAVGRRKMADARISGAGVNPDKLCRAMIQGERAWEAFQENDPYELKDY